MKEKNNRIGTPAPLANPRNQRYYVRSAVDSEYIDTFKDYLQN